MQTETSDIGVGVIEKAMRKVHRGKGASSWIGWVGDFVVVEGARGVVWMTPKYSGDGGFVYPAPPGTHPVYAMANDQSEAPEPPEFRVHELFLPFAPWEQVAQAHWQHFNDDTGAAIEDCAFLGTDRSEKAAVKRWYDSTSDTIPWIEEAVASADVLANPGNYPSRIVDPESGENIVAFPVGEGYVDAYVGRSEDGELLALMPFIYYC